jgi:cell division protein FtsX
MLTACSSSPQQPKELGEFVVFMDTHATAAETKAARSYLAKLPRVDRFKFVSKEANYADFRRFEGAERADLVNTITPADLPASFDVFARTEKDARALAPQLRRLPGVDQLVIAPPKRELRQMCESLKRLKRKGDASSMFDKWCRPYW